MKVNFFIFMLTTTYYVYASLMYAIVYIAIWY